MTKVPDSGRLVPVNTTRSEPGPRGYRTICYLLSAICYLLSAIRPERPLAQSHRHENVQEWASDFDHPRTHFVYQIQIDLIL